MGRLIVNGFVLPLVKNMKLKLEIDGEQEIEVITLDVKGGKLTVKNENGPAMKIVGTDKGEIHLIGKYHALEATSDGTTMTGAVIMFEVSNSVGVKV